MEGPPPTAKALESADDGLLALSHVEHLIGAHALHDIEVTLDAAHVLRRIEEQVVQVEASAEGLAFAGENDNAAILVIANEVQEVVELCHLLVGHCIEVTWIVERADVDRTRCSIVSFSYLS